MALPEWVVLEDGSFVVEQCLGCPLPGYVIVRSKVPVLDLGSLPEDVSAELGPLLRRVVHAVQRVLHPARVYVAQFGEEGETLHFHVFPRTAALTREFLREFPEQQDRIHGPILLDWARERYRDRLPSEETLRVLEALRDSLRNVPPAEAPDRR